MYALGVDIGTTTISFVVWNIEKEEVEDACTLKNDSFLQSDHVWEKMQDPEKILSKAIGQIEILLNQYKEFQVIGLTGQMHGIVYLDKNGNHISPLYTWQDQRAEVTGSDGESICSMVERVSGLHVPAGYGLVTHLYNQKNNLVNEDAVCICTIMDYLGMKLTGRKTPLMHSSNAASLGFFNVPENVFQKDAMNRAEINASLCPEATEDFSILGEYKGIPVAVAIGDNQASFLGSVTDMKDTILVNMGTGGQISVLSDAYLTAKEMETRPFSKGKYLLVGASICGGKAYAILADFFTLTAKAMGITEVDPYKLMDRLLESRIDAEKLIVQTTFAGTRNCPDQRGSILNLTEDNFRPDMLVLGILEGMAEELYQMYRSVEAQLPGKRTKLVASGNGLRRNHWLQEIMKDKFGLELILAEHTEEAATGAALAGLAAVKNGLK